MDLDTFLPFRQFSLQPTTEASYCLRVGNYCWHKGTDYLHCAGYLNAGYSHVNKLTREPGVPRCHVFMHVCIYVCAGAIIPDSFRSERAVFNTGECQQ